MTTVDDTAPADDGPMTAQELVDYAARQGIVVTMRQLERWHKADCLPRPEHPHPQGVRGSTSHYPAGTASQLLALCRLSTQERRLDYIRLQLWLDRYPVPLKALRKSFHRALFAGMAKGVKRLGGEQIHDPLESAEALTALTTPQLSRFVLGRLIRRRLRRPADQESLLTLFYQLFFGATPAFEAGEAHTGEDEMSLTQLFVTVAGLERAQTDRLGDAQPWLPQDIAPALHEMAERQLLSIGQLVTAYRNASLAEWEQARADAEALFINVPQMIRGTEAAFGKNVIGLGIFTRLPFEQANLTLRVLGIAGLLVLRRAGYGKDLDEFLALARTQGPMWERARALLLALQDEIPEVGAALTIDIRQFQDPGAFERYIQSRKGLAKKYESELATFWVRHPDLDPAVLAYGDASLPKAS